MDRRACGFRLADVWLAACLCAFALSPTHAQVAVPPPLQDWQGWVLRGEEYRNCPFLASADPNDPSSFRCAWPEQLTLAVDARGGTFSQRWQVHAESWIRLPGSVENWPQDVLINGEAGAIVLRGGGPSARLAAGTYTISGRFVWATRPESLPVPSQTGLLALSVDGQRVSQPERPDGTLWLGKRHAADQAQQIEVQVYRLVQDEVPVRLVTLVRLQVAGDGREEILARVLPEGMTALRLTSELPVRVEADGRLRVQVRPGTWEVTLAARGTNVAETLSRPQPLGTWAHEEIWSFAGDDRLRVASAEGVEGIDPAQANVPSEWQGFPAFRMSPESNLKIVERSRGLTNADDNRLTLNRQLWLDFDHMGFTAVDEIQGAMRRDWRLDMSLPYRLESARSGTETLLVTEGADPKKIGVELRSPQLQLTTVARTAQTSGPMPATGWETRFEQVRGELHLPPGHRLLAVRGADDAPTSWLESWGLWNLFGVLVVVVFTGWVAGRTAGAIALGALLLMYQEGPGFIWLWGNLLAAVAVARAAPEGRLRKFAGVYRSASFALLGVAMLPFLWGQVRYALYPQLEAGDYGVPQQMGSIAVTGSRSMPTPPAHMMERVPKTEFETDMRPIVEGEAAKGEGAPPSVPGAVPYSLPGKPSSSAAGYLNAMQVVQRYAPGTALQAGPGVPGWRFQTYPFSWSGPVDPSQTVHFVYIGALAMSLWRTAGVGLLGLLFLWLLRVSFTWQWSSTGGRTFSKAALVFLALAGLLLPQARASTTPDPALIKDLKARLTEPPECAPTCAEVLSALVAVSADRLEVTLQASALANVAIAVPFAGDRWQIDHVMVDGQASLAVGREADGSLWVPLQPGARTIHLSGRLASAESVQIVFPQPPRTISVSSVGWDVSGVNEGRLLSGSLELVRRREGTEQAGNLAASSEFPAFVRVARNFNLDLDWGLTTTVERIAPERAAITVEVPLVSGESVLTEGIELRDGRTALIGLAPGQSDASWSSGLRRTETLELSLPQGVLRTEVWNFVVNPEWNVAFEGLPAVLPDTGVGSLWVYQYYPRAGEGLKLRITRPKPAEGRTLAMDAVGQSVTVGKRSSTTHLEFRYRSTQGGRHAIEVPEDARVTAVAIDGVPVQLRPDQSELSIALLPGEHGVQVEWTRATGPALRTYPAAVDLRSPASNISTTLVMPDNRWVLAAFGAGVGPAVLYWGELLIFFLTAWLLGRRAFSPIRTWEWLLLGLGLSTLSWGVFLGMAVWFFAMRWRERWDGRALRWQFNAVQLLLALLTLCAISSLVFSGVRYGLLAAPDMGVAGPGSGGNTFTWFVDQTASSLPQPLIVSVPMWIYKAFMFAWALWIALALAGWMRWAWHAWIAGGLWRGRTAT